MPSLDINRINIALYNISADTAEQAVEGFELNLRERLAAMRFHNMSAIDIAELSVGPIKEETPLDAAGLRALLVNNIMQQITQLRDGGVSCAFSSVAL